MGTYVRIQPSAGQEEDDVECGFWSRDERDEGEEGEERRERAALDCEEGVFDGARVVVAHEARALVDEDV